MADEETREKKFLINDTVRYGLRRAQLRTTIRWLLKRRGIEIKRPFSPEGRKRLREFRLQEMDMRLDELELVGSITQKLDGQISSIVPIDPGAGLLDTLPGVAPYTALFSPPRLETSTASQTRSTSAPTSDSHPPSTSRETCS
jgi:hypothetical protein